MTTGRSAHYYSVSGNVWGVDFVPAPPSPTIGFTAIPLTASCAAGQNATSQSFYVWNAGGEGTLNYTISDDAAWLSQTPATGSSTGEYDLIAVDYDTAALPWGIYTATITITDSAATNSPQTIPVTLRVSPDLPTAVDDTSRAWTPSGDAAWFGQTDVSYDGQHAAQSGTVADNQTSSLTTAVEGVGDVAFWWKTSSQDGSDTQTFYIDDVPQDSLSGDSGWVQKTYRTTPGIHILRWTYAKDAADATGSDCGWIDQFSFTEWTPTLEESLDYPPASWFKTGGDWTGQTAVTHDGISAGRSPVPAWGPMSSAIQFSVRDAGTISFWWKVSSEENSDYLRFYINDVETAAISGEQDWAYVSFEVADGWNEMKWLYTKDAVGNAGSDCGWLDEVNFVRTNPPVIESNLYLLTPICTQGENAAAQSFTLWNSGGYWVNPVFTKNAAWIITPSCASLSYSHETHPTAITYDTSSLPEGIYTDTLIISDSYGVAVPIEIQIVLTVGNAGFIPLPIALDNELLDWTTAGDAPWHGQSFISYDGVDAARCGAVGEGQYSELSATVQGPGTFSFWWKSSSKRLSDTFVFSIDDIAQSAIDNETDWAQLSYTIQPALHTLKWVYTNNSAGYSNNECGWVDQASFVPDTVPEISVSTATLSSTCVVGETAPSGTFEVWNSWGGMLDYVITSDAPWLSATPDTGYSYGVHDTITANYDTGGLAQGIHTATLTVTDSDASNSPETIEVTITVNPTVSMAVDNETLVFDDAGTTPWYGQMVASHDGVDAARSGAVSGDGVFSTLSTTVFGPGTLSFWWKVSCSLSNHARLYYSTEGYSNDEIYGEVDWEYQEYYIPPGPQTLSWKYYKQFDLPDGADAGWVDEITFTPNTFSLVYVDANNTAPDRDGSSWAKAFTSLQDGVYTAYAAGGGEVWAAAGGYDAIADPVLTMMEGVEIYGGFSGVETERDARDPVLNPTIVSGGTWLQCIVGADNALLDGFTVKYGTAATLGGGMFNDGVSPTIANCVFTLNDAQSGGAVYNHACSPTFINCVFYENTATEYGGGIYNVDATPQLMNCTFAYNSAEYGGAVANNAAAPIVTNCILWDDTATTSGNEIYDDTSSPVVTYSCIAGGYAGTGNISGDPLFENIYAGDLRLTADSHCIDAGTAVGAPATDILGGRRIIK